MSATKSVRIGSAIFNADHGHLADVVAELDQAGIDFYHWDVFDGHFIPELGFPPRALQAVRHLTGKPFEVHLAVVELKQFVTALATAGADLIFIPAESTPLLFEGISLVRNAGLKAGISIALGTPLSAIVEILPFVDSVLVLSRAYGEATAGAHFVSQSMSKVKAIRALMKQDGLALDIEVAGGLSAETAASAVAAGATSVVFGSTLHKNKNLTQRLRELRDAVGSIAAT
ncbi:MAG: hypothetical protein H5T68_08930 [Chloroflexi bacterium]|nr:hypothetical protein [Chloroflexota bacterium]